MTTAIVYSVYCSAQNVKCLRVVVVLAIMNTPVVVVQMTTASCVPTLKAEN